MLATTIQLARTKALPKIYRPRDIGTTTIQTFQLERTNARDNHPTCKNQCAVNNLSATWHWHNNNSNLPTWKNQCSRQPSNLQEQKRFQKFIGHVTLAQQQFKPSNLKEPMLATTIQLARTKALPKIYRPRDIGTTTIQTFQLERTNARDNHPTCKNKSASKNLSATWHWHNNNSNHPTWKNQCSRQPSNLQEQKRFQKFIGHVTLAQQQFKPSNLKEPMLATTIQLARTKALPKIYRPRDIGTTTIQTIQLERTSARDNHPTCKNKSASKNLSATWHWHNNNSNHPTWKNQCSRQPSNLQEQKRFQKFIGHVTLAQQQFKPSNLKEPMRDNHPTCKNKSASKNLSATWHWHNNNSNHPTWKNQCSRQPSNLQEQKRFQKFIGHVTLAQQQFKPSNLKEPMLATTIQLARTKALPKIYRPRDIGTTTIQTIQLERTNARDNHPTCKNQCAVNSLSATWHWNNNNSNHPTWKNQCSRQPSNLQEQKRFQKFIGHVTLAQQQFKPSNLKEPMLATTIQLARTKALPKIYRPRDIGTTTIQTIQLERTNARDNHPTCKNKSASKNLSATWHWHNNNSNHPTWKNQCSRQPSNLQEQKRFQKFIGHVTLAQQQFKPSNLKEPMLATTIQLARTKALPKIYRPRDIGTTTIQTSNLKEPMLATTIQLARTKALPKIYRPRDIGTTTIQTIQLDNHPTCKNKSASKNLSATWHWHNNNSNHPTWKNQCSRQPSNLQEQKRFQKFIGHVTLEQQQFKPSNLKEPMLATTIQLARTKALPKIYRPRDIGTTTIQTFQLERTNARDNHPTCKNKSASKNLSATWHWNNNNSNLPTWKNQCSRQPSNLQEQKRFQKFIGHVTLEQQQFKPSNLKEPMLATTIQLARTKALPKFYRPRDIGTTTIQTFQLERTNARDNHPTCKNKSASKNLSATWHWNNNNSNLPTWKNQCSRQPSNLQEQKRFQKFIGHVTLAQQQFKPSNLKEPMLATTIQLARTNALSIIYRPRDIGTTTIQTFQLERTNARDNHPTCKNKSASKIYRPRDIGTTTIQTFQLERTNARDNHPTCKNQCAVNNLSATWHWHNNNSNLPTWKNQCSRQPSNLQEPMRCQ